MMQHRKTLLVPLSIWSITLSGYLFVNVTVGLIIDAFGELRDQQEQVKEDMEVKYDVNLRPAVI